MSRLRQMRKLKAYRRRRNNRRITFGVDQKLDLDFELLTPSALFKQSIENNEIYDLTYYYVELQNYFMKEEHTIIEHIKVVNEMLQKIMKLGIIIPEFKKYEALKNTLPMTLQEKLEGFWLDVTDKDFWTDFDEQEDFLRGKTRNYDTLIYLFLEDHFWKNLKKSTILSGSSSLRRTSRTSMSIFPWHQNLVENIFNYAWFERSVPKRVWTEYP